MIRWLVTFTLILSFSPMAYAGSEPFTGAWGIKWCGNGSTDECGGFYLYLVQTGNRICGNHFYSTLNAGRLNEGSPRSISGTVSGSVATVSIKSGRDNSVFRATAKIIGKQLTWRLLKQLKRGDLDEPLIEENAFLLKIAGEEASNELRRVESECNAF